jgi:hypothetical protein
MENETEKSNSNNTGTESVADSSVPEEKNGNPVEQAETGRNPDGTFKKGFSGNPKGGPKKPTIWTYLEDGEDETKIREFINDPKFLDKVAEYILGKPKQPLVGGDEGDEPIRITGINYIIPNGDNSKTRPETGSSVSSAGE